MSCTCLISLLFGALQRLLDSLLSVLISAIRLLCNWRKYNHIARRLVDVLHWLPVRFVLSLKYAGWFTSTCATTVCRRIHPLWGCDWATDKYDFRVRQMRIQFRDNTFSGAFPRFWNRNPALNGANSIYSFKTGLKLFVQLLVICVTRRNLFACGHFHNLWPT